MPDFPIDGERGENKDRPSPRVRVAKVPGSDRRLLVAPTASQALDSTACAMCGRPLRGDRSKEHVFAKWLMPHYEALPQPFSVAWSSDDSFEVHEKRELIMGNHVAGRICRTCNNGWMSQLEDQAKLALLDVASKRRSLASLIQTERLLLARWATKTALVARSSAPGPQVAPPAHGLDLSRGRMPPVAVIGRQSPADLGLSWYATQRWMVRYPDSAREDVARLIGASHKTVVTVGHAIFCVCFWTEASWPITLSAASHVVVGVGVLDPKCEDDIQSATGAQTPE